ncbi:MAG: 30S ribosomal protein S5 [Firmicutes bacterium]|nr:30S ribosomal protein S5 [Bacillota bacterium]
MEEQKVEKTEASAENKPAAKGNKFDTGGRGQQGGRPDRPRREREPRENDGLEKHTLLIRRVVAVTKGGKNIKFSAAVVVGDGKGSVGLGVGKALETPYAIEKAVQDAKKNMFKINLDGHTIPHKIIGKFGASIVYINPAKEGTGVVAGGAARPIFKLSGIQNVSCKSYGSRHNINMARAVIDGLSKLRTKEQVAAIRGKKVEEL